MKTKAIACICALSLTVGLLPAPLYADSLSNDRAFEESSIGQALVGQNPDASTSGDSSPALTYALDFPAPENGTQSGDQALPQDDSTLVSGDWSYALLDDGNAEVVGYSGSATTVTIPADFGGHAVTEIGLSAFAHSSIQNLTMPDSVTAVRPSAFYASALTSVTFSKNLTRIGDGAFASTNLTGVTLPDSLVKLEENAFNGCAYLTTFHIPRNVEACTREENLKKGDEQYSYTSYFTPIDGCERLTSITVDPANPNFTSVDGVLYSKDMTVIYAYPLGKAAETYTVPNGVKYIGSYCFFGAPMKNINLPDTLIQVGMEGFGLSKIETLVLPDSVQNIHSWIAAYCPNLTSVVIGSGITEIGTEGGQGCFGACPKLANVTIGPNVERITNQAFAGCTSLTSVNIPDKVTALDYKAFSGCTSLTTVTGGKGLKDIRRVAFGGCTNLTTFTLPDSLRFLDSEAFVDCDSYTVSVPAGMKKYPDGTYIKADVSIPLSGNEKYEYAYQVLDVVNSQRAAQGLSALSMDASLLTAAMQRAAEIAVNFDHTRPVGLIAFSADQKMTAENIAFGQSSPEEVMNSWMNSDGHRANILEPAETSIGIGCFEHNGALYWVQCFGTTAATAAPHPADTPATHEVDVMTEDCAATADVYVKTPMAIGERQIIGARFKNVSYPSISYVPDTSAISCVSSNPSALAVEQTADLVGVGHGTSKISVCVNGFTMGSADVSCSFADVVTNWPNDWFVTDGWLDYVVQKGLMSGYAGTNDFGPYDNITRGQVAVILYRYADGTTFGSTTDVMGYPSETVFNDEEANVYYTAAINWAKNAGVMTGDESTGFTTVRPNDPITREELCLMLYRFANAREAGANGSVDGSAILGMDEVSDWARDGVDWAVSRGVIGGVDNGDGTFSMKPQDTTWRASMAKMITVTARDVLKA